MFCHLFWAGVWIFHSFQFSYGLMRAWSVPGIFSMHWVLYCLNLNFIRFIYIFLPCLYQDVYSYICLALHTYEFSPNFHIWGRDNEWYPFLTISSMISFDLTYLHFYGYFSSMILFWFDLSIFFIVSHDGTVPMSMILSDLTYLF